MNLPFYRRLFELKPMESSLEKDTESCWRRLFWNYRQNDGVVLFKAFIDCALVALRDHLDEVDWFCRDTWRVGRVAPSHRSSGQIEPVSTDDS